MNRFSKAFNRFCYRNRNKGIPNLMLYISLGSALVYIMSLIAKSNVLYSMLYFNRDAILKGQVWRLISYPLTYGMGNNNVLLVLVGLFCYYSLGRSIEARWGTFKFNVFYLTGVVMMDIYSMLFGCQANAYYLNLSLFLSFATLYPDSGFLFLFIIPVKAWIFALFDLAIVVLDFILNPFPYNLFPIIALANYFLFFGKEVLNIIPLSWRMRLGIKKKRSSTMKSEPIPFIRKPETQPSSQTRPYTHRCTVCGKTDVTNPELEFRYCSKCNGYYCYCSDHINNHIHIQ